MTKLQLARQLRTRQEELAKVPVFQSAAWRKRHQAYIDRRAKIHNRE